MRSLIFLAIAGATLAIRVPRPDADPHWAQFRKIYLKEYRDRVEELARRFIFEDNLSKIQQFNQLNASDAGFRLGLNEFADLVGDFGYSLCEQYLSYLLNQ